MKFRVNAKYEASIQMDVIAESPEEAEIKAREIFETCDSEDFNIGNEIDIDVETIVDAVDCLDCIDEPAELGELIRTDAPELPVVADLTGDIYIHRGNVIPDFGNIEIGYDLGVEENNIGH